MRLRLRTIVEGEGQTLHSLGDLVNAHLGGLGGRSDGLSEHLLGSVEAAGGTDGACVQVSFPRALQLGIALSFTFPVFRAILKAQQNVQHVFKLRSLMTSALCLHPVNPHPYQDKEQTHRPTGLAWPLAILSSLPPTSLSLLPHPCPALKFLSWKVFKCKCSIFNGQKTIQLSVSSGVSFIRLYLSRNLLI